MIFVLALVLGVALMPVAAGIAIAILVRDGRPIFYVAERMQTPDRAFAFWKFRTMRVVTGDAGVTGGDKSSRLTRTGGFLRRTRLDEIPQLWNVLKGDISFVGPASAAAKLCGTVPGSLREGPALSARDYGLGDALFSSP